MLSAPLLGESLDATATSHARSPYWRYLLWFLLFPLLGYIAAFAWVRSAGFEHWNQSQWGPRLDFAYRTEHQNADVLLFGDSSAFIGVDPRLVSRQLGVKTLVLPATIGSLPITGQMVLDRYLATNTPPRLLVIFLPAWNLDYEHTVNLHPFEGEEMLFRHGTFQQIGSFVLRHPHEAFLFPFRLFSTFDPARLRKARARPDSGREIAEALGHFSDTEPFPALTDSCTLPEGLVKQDGDATLRGLLRKYGARLPTMVYLAPVPGCRNASAFTTRSYTDLGGAAPPHALPAGTFLDDFGYAHVRPPFIQQTSQLFADAVAQRLALPGATPQPATNPAPAAAREPR